MSIDAERVSGMDGHHTWVESLGRENPARWTGTKTQTSKDMHIGWHVQ